MTTASLRRTGSFLSPWERPLLIWIAARLPSWLSPDGLTAIGFAGALVCAGGYALGSRTPWALALASLGLLINWFGDSLDGTLARVRRIERPRYGYFLDNSLDMLEQLLIAAGLACSGYVRSDVSFFALAALLMMSSLSALKACVAPVHQMAYGGFGLTELRLAGLVANGVLFLFPPSRVGAFGLPLTYPNIGLLAWSLATLAMFVISVWADARQLAAEDRRTQGEAADKS